jgi:long-chain acyl-CoA synthetase
LDHYPVPVVPVYIRGTYEAMPRGRFLRRFEKVTVTFGEPFHLDRVATSREQVVEAVRERVVALGERG